jgi:hypothetical protein
MLTSVVFEQIKIPRFVPVTTATAQSSRVWESREILVFSLKPKSRVDGAEKPLLFLNAGKLILSIFIVNRFLIIK